MTLKRFLIRVVLHDAPDPAPSHSHSYRDPHSPPRPPDYDGLHARLDAFGMSRLVTEADGLSYLLPPGLYQYHGNMPSGLLLEVVKACAQEVGLTFAAGVAEVAETRWYGLPLAPLRKLDPAP